MGIAFGIIVLVLIILAVWNRRKTDKAWVQEERYEESGAWIDKRAGERGTYGSLDEAMERERLYVSRQNRIHELARIIRDFAFEHVDGFHLRSDAEIKNYAAFARRQSEQCLILAEKALQGKITAEDAGRPEGTAVILHKKMLDFLYQVYPNLLDLDLETIRLLDAGIGKLADACLQA